MGGDNSTRASPRRELLWSGREKPGMTPPPLRESQSLSFPTFDEFAFPFPILDVEVVSRGARHYCRATGHSVPGRCRLCVFANLIAPAGLRLIEEFRGQHR